MDSAPSRQDSRTGNTDTDFKRERTTANNAVDDVKAACDYTTNANNNEGVVAELIEKFIFNEI